MALPTFSDPLVRIPATLATAHHPPPQEPNPTVSTRSPNGVEPRGARRALVVAVLPMFSTTFYFNLCAPLLRILQAADADLALVHASSQQEADLQLDRLFAERACDGVVLCSMTLGEARRRQAQSFGIPVVALDYHAIGLPHARVDNVEGGQLLSRALSERGSRKQALLIGTRQSHAFRDREQGFRSVCPPGSPIVECDTELLRDPTPVVRALFANDPHIDGVACTCDTLAVGVVRTLREMGRAIPGSVQVIGFDDMPLMESLNVSSVHQPITELGSWGAEAILRLLREPEDVEVEPVVLPLAVVHRGTTRPLGAGSRVAPAG